LKKSLFLLLCCLTAIGMLFFAGCKKSEKSEKRLVMVTEATFPPYEYRDENGDISGIDPEIIREIARRNDMEVVIEDMKFNSIIAAVQTGKADVAASGITVTEERKQMVDFTIPYASAAQVILIKDGSPITHVTDIRGKRIGVQHGTTGDSYVTDKMKLEPERFDNAALVVAALNSGKIDAAVLDDAPAKVFLKENPGLRKLDEPLTEEFYAFAINKDRRDLLEMFNRTLQEMKDDGTLDEIIKRNMEKEITPAVNRDELSWWGKVKYDFRQNFIAGKRYMYLVRGFVITLEVAGASVVLGVLIGFLIAIIRSTADQTGKLKIANALCKIYLTVIRGTPVVVQLLIIYFVIFGAFDVDKVLVAILAFGLNSGAYVAEIIRGGIMSIDRGQMEAGRSLGLSYNKTMALVIMPQALKNVLPALGNEFIVLLKETSVAGFIALEDLTKGGDIIRSQTYNAFMPLIAVALVYLAVVMLFSYLLTIVEKRLKKNE